MKVKFIVCALAAAMTVATPIESAVAGDRHGRDLALGLLLGAAAVGTTAAIMSGPSERTYYAPPPPVVYAPPPPVVYAPPPQVVYAPPPVMYAPPPPVYYAPPPPPRYYYYRGY